MRHFRFALDMRWKQWMHGSKSGPGFLVNTKEPDCVGRQACRLGRSGNLDGRVQGLRRKESFLQRAVQTRQEFRPADAPAIETERGGCVQSLLPTTLRLELRASAMLVARPTHGL